MAARRWAIDFGTSSTVGVVTGPGGRPVPVLVDASPLLPSAVFADATGELLTGADAQRAATARPDGYEPHPKRRVSDGTVWLGGRDVPVEELIAAVLRRIAGHALQASGGPAAAIVLTVPARWGPARREVLLRAAARAGLDPVEVVPEPVAAAAYYAVAVGQDLTPGRHLLVYDLGAGTFDVAVVRTGPGGLEVLAADGLLDLGGLDLDALVVDRAQAITGAAAGDAWRRLRRPETPADRRAWQELWSGARAAKEQLSRRSSTELYVPLADAVVTVTREEFETAARPLLERAAALTGQVLDTAAVPAGALAGVFLVGGASRVPLAGTLVHQRLGVVPILVEQPELAVAEGALILAGPAPRPLKTPTTPTPATPAPAGRRFTAARLGAVLAAMAAVAVVVAAVVWWPRPPAEPEALARVVTATPPDRPVTGVHLVRVLTGHNGAVWRVAFSPDGNTLAGVGKDGIVRLWDTARPALPGRELIGHGEPVAAVMFSPTAQVVASAGYDGNVRLWDTVNGTQIGPALHSGAGIATEVVFSPDGRSVASIDSSAVRLWDVASQQQRGEPITTTGGVYTRLAFLTGGTLAVAASNSGISLWDVDRRSQVSAAAGYGGSPHFFPGDFSRDGRTFATADDGVDVRLLNLPERSERKILPGTAVASTGVALSPRGRTLAVRGFRAGVTIWDTESGRKIATPRDGGSGEVNGMQFSRDGRFFATAQEDGTVSLYAVDH